MPYTAVITGATKGIGLAITQLFAAKGFHLAITARTENDLEELARDLREKFPEIKVIAKPTDLADRSQVIQFIELVNNTWPSVDVLINNAGIFLQGELLSEPEDHLDLMMRVNLHAPYQLCRGFCPQMQAAGKGHIFNICSVASQKVFPGSGSYATTKFALLGMTKALRQELLASPIKVTAVLPGATWTASWEGATLPEERLMPASDIAQALWDVWQLSPRTVVEELILRPQEGDL
ncbi:MAG: SDR family oxidoreductase [Saprospiraceae bacterium]|nr:SDR family oxidoreductase [Saprospiraceae bacterium]